MKKKRIHLGLDTDYLHRDELFFRLNISKSVWQFHTDKNSVVPTDLIRTQVGELLDTSGAFKHRRGRYVKWPEVGMLMMNAFSTKGYNQAADRLASLGLTAELEVASEEYGVIRMDDKAIKIYKQAQEREGLEKTEVPEFAQHGIFGVHSSTSTGAITRDKKLLGNRQRIANSKKSSQVTEQEAPIKYSVGDSAETPSENAMSIDFDNLDFTNAAEIGAAQRKAKLLTELTKARKEEFALAKLSNSIIDIKEVEKLLKSVMTALRTTVDQAVPKFTAEVYSEVVTQLVRIDPTLQKVLTGGVDTDILNERVRGVFDKSMYELSELLKSFSKSIEED